MKLKDRFSPATRWKIAATTGVIAFGALGISIVSADRQAPLPSRIQLKDAIQIDSTSDDVWIEPEMLFRTIPAPVFSIGDSPYDSPDATVRYEDREASPFDSTDASASFDSPLDSPDDSASSDSPFDSPDDSASSDSPFDSPDDSASSDSPFDSPDGSASFDSPDNS